MKNIFNFLTKKTVIKLIICFALAIFVVWLLSPIFAFIGYLLSVLVLTAVAFWGLSVLAEKWKWQWWTNDSTITF